MTRLNEREPRTKSDLTEGEQINAVLAREEGLQQQTAMLTAKLQQLKENVDKKEDARILYLNLYLNYFTLPTNLLFLVKKYHS